MQTAEQILQECRVEGTIVRLPPQQLDRKIYMEVAKKLELIGGKWKGGKVAGFVFQENPTDLLSQMANGEKRNLKKEFQFFATPDELADQLVNLAQIRKGDRVLEPSAGQGAIIKAINRATGFENINAYELMKVNQTFIKNLFCASFLGVDFLQCKLIGMFDRIVANPPFSKNQDIDHIRKMYECLAPGGRIVSMAGKHWRISNNKKETQFREWLENINATVHDVGGGVFKESGTNIETVIIVIDKD